MLLPDTPSSPLTGSHRTSVHEKRTEAPLCPPLPRGEGGWKLAAFYDNNLFRPVSNCGFSPAASMSSGANRSQLPLHSFPRARSLLPPAFGRPEFGHHNGKRRARRGRTAAVRPGIIAPATTRTAPCGGNGRKSPGQQDRKSGFSTTASFLSLRTKELQTPSSRFNRSSYHKSSARSHFFPGNRKKIKIVFLPENPDR